MAGLAPAGKRRMRRLAAPAAALGLLSCALAAAGPASAASTVAGQPAATAPGGPGAMSFFDLARKDCLGTARNTGSKAWYTVAGGVRRSQPARLRARAEHHL